MQQSCPTAIILLKSKKLYITPLISYTLSDYIDNEWLKTYHPIEIVREYDQNRNFNRILMKYIIDYSIKNVRGGKYTNINLTKEEIKQINTDIEKYNLTKNTKQSPYLIDNIFGIPHNTSDDDSEDQFNL
jgi:hypothetical protein